MLLVLALRDETVHERAELLDVARSHCDLTLRVVHRGCEVADVARALALAVSARGSGLCCDRACRGGAGAGCSGVAVALERIPSSLAVERSCGCGCALLALQTLNDTRGNVAVVDRCCCCSRSRVNELALALEHGRALGGAAHRGRVASCERHGLFVCRSIASSKCAWRSRLSSAWQQHHPDELCELGLASFGVFEFV